MPRAYAEAQMFVMKSHYCSCSAILQALTGGWSCASSFAAQVTNCHEFLCAETAAFHGLGEELGTTTFKTQRFGIQTHGVFS